VIFHFVKYLDQEENCALLGYYANGDPLPTFQGNVLVPSSRVFLDFLTLEDGIDTLSQNAGKRLPFDAV
jgi:hypothetical protein